MIAVFLRLAAASCGDDCEPLRGITIDSVTHLHTKVSECDTDPCGSEIIGSWNVSGLDRFYLLDTDGFPIGPFSGTSYPILNLDGWGDQIGNASLAYLFDFFNGEIEVSDWDVSNVEDMEFMCYYSTCNVDISDWNVGNVKNMISMFADSQFNSNISAWDVSNVKYMEGMFINSQFNSNISAWNVSKVEDMYVMFSSSQFNSDISGWNLSSSLRPINVMQMFSNSNIASDLSSWPAFNLTVSAAKDAYDLRSDYPDACTPGGTGSCAYARNLVIEDVEVLHDLISQCSSPVCGSEIIGSWNVSGLDRFYLLHTDGFPYGPFYETSYPILNLDGWGDQIGNASLAYMFDGVNGEIEVSDWDVSNVEDMESMCYSSTCNVDISGWNVGNVKNMISIFASSQFNSDISGWDVSNVEHMTDMFYYSRFNSDISGWNVSNVENMVRMFASSQFNSNISGWDVSKVEYMFSMFSDSQFNSDISGWDVSNVGDFRFMFSNSNIASDLSSWPAFNLTVSAAKDAYDLRSDYPDACTPGGTGSCAYARNLVIEDVEVLHDLISQCSSPVCGSEIIGSWNVSGLDAFNIGGDGPFNGKDYDILNLSGWKDQIGNASLANLFSGYQGSSVDIADWDVSNVENMETLFLNSRFDGDISRWDVSNVRNMQAMFSSSVFNSDISGWNVSKVESVALIFASSQFEGDISSWGERLPENVNTASAFLESKIACDLSSWPTGDSDLREDYPDGCLPGSLTGCAYTLRNIVIEDVDTLYDSIGQCLSPLCGAEIIGTWNVSALARFDRNYTGPFSGTTYSSLNLSGWKDQFGTASLAYMFKDVSSDIDITGWDVDEVTSMEYMFSHYTGSTLDLAAWNVSKVGDFRGMFQSSTFDSDISGWRPESATDLSTMFRNSAFSGDVSGWGEYLDVPVKLNRVFAGSPAMSDLSAWPEYGDDVNYFRLIYGLPDDFPISCTPFSNETCFIRMRGKVITTVAELGESIDECDSDLCGSQIIGSWNVSRLDRFYNGSTYVFAHKNYSVLDLGGWGDQIGNASLDFLFWEYKGRSVEISAWDVSSVKSMAGIFGYSNVDAEISGWNVGNVENMTAMFAGSNFNPDISAWTVSKVEDTSFMFFASALNSDISSWTLSSLSAEYIDGMFNASIIECDLSSWPHFGYSVSEARNAYHLRADYPDGCVPGSFTVCEFNVRGKVISTVEELYVSISECDSDLCGAELIGSWDVRRLDRFSKGGVGPFFLKHYPVLNLDGWKDQIGNASLAYLFHGFHPGSLEISGWDVSNVENMEWMFLESGFDGNISGWDVSKVEDMEGMFYGSIFDSDISRWDVGEVKNMKSMFSYSKFSGTISDWAPSLTVETAKFMFLGSNMSSDLSSWPSFCLDQAKVKEVYGLRSDHPDPPSACSDPADSSDSDHTAIIVVSVIAVLFLALVIAFRRRIFRVGEPETQTFL